MKIDWLKHIAFALTIPLVVSSCNGGGTNLAEGGIGGSGISMGTVSAIGSIWVNGVEYDTTGATITLADEGTVTVDTAGTAGGDPLRLGMVLTVKGTIDAGGLSGTATSVTYADNLEGPIDGAPTSNTFVVLGQMVIVDDRTKFKDVTDLSALGDGNIVEVSGFRDANGNIQATYIEKQADNFANGTEIELKGTISAVDPGAYTITIGAQEVDITNALLSGFPGAPAINDFVEAKGSSIVGGVLIADSVELESSVLDTEDHGEAEMEGIVTSVVAPGSEFFIGTQRVQVASGAEFNGGLAADIVPGVRLEVEGSYSDGVLIAEEISFEDGIELEANIATTNMTARTITLDGLGLEVSVDDFLTEFEGTATQFTELNIGDHVKIRARETATGLLLATKLAASVASQDIVLQGPLDTWDSTPGSESVTVLGIVAKDIGTYEIESSGTVTAATFFDTVQVDDLVELEGRWDGVTLTWEAIELDD